MGAEMRFIRCRQCKREEVIENEQVPPGWSRLQGWAGQGVEELWYCSPDCAEKNLVGPKNSPNGRYRPKAER